MIGKCFVAALLVMSVGAQAKYPAALVAQGRYLAIAGDCTACHTAADGPEFAGGTEIASPLGAIIATNITPSKRFGIGNYSERQFAAALRRGRRADGTHLYPAMPYTAYTLLSEADMHALYAYFMEGVAPVDRATPVTALAFPFNLRSSMAAWNALFLTDARFAPNPAHDARWNRGAYLVEALGHCSACHSARRLLMQEDRTRALGGAPFGAWYAPNITSDPISGIGGWSVRELTDYLGTGVAAGKARAAGGMAEVVEHSLSRMTASDLKAMAIYLKTVPAVVDAATVPRAPAAGLPPFESRVRVAGATEAKGAVLFSGLCASCHGEAGTGTADRAYPDLSRAASVVGTRPDNLIAVILFGVDRRVGQNHVAMPDFGAQSFVQSLSDADVADVASFVRARFGPGGTISAAYVATARTGGARSPLPVLLRGAMLVFVLAGIMLLAWRLRRRAS